MADLPNELFAKIFRGLGPSELFNISLASRRLHELALPFKFRKLNFTSLCPDDVGRFGGRVTWTEPKSVQFCRALYNLEDSALVIAPYVRECGIKYWNSWGEGDAAKERALGECFRAFTALPNLVALTIVNTTVYPIAFDYLGQLKRLRSLRFSYCSSYKGYNPHPSHSGFYQLSKLKRVTSLACSSSEFDSTLASFVPKERLQILESDSWTITEQVLTATPRTQLIELWLSSPFSDLERSTILWDYLSRASHLTHLSLMDTTKHGDWHPPPPSLTLSLPQLRYLRTSLHCAIPFASQPMRNLDIMIIRNQDLKVGPVLQGTVFPYVENITFSVPLSMLQLQQDFIDQSFPRLRTLDARYEELQTRTTT